MADGRRHADMVIRVLYTECSNGLTKFFRRKFYGANVVPRSRRTILFRTSAFGSLYLANTPPVDSRGSHCLRAGFTDRRFPLVFNESHPGLLRFDALSRRRLVNRRFVCLGRPPYAGQTHTK